ncbi:hypothetical protein KUTeg_004059 [Tegillarca granosa]|uniref:L-Fucosyltransferase n=1 Tax=Tegillarca granosa TaxID=220873 RepID=A0ABQ9FNZ4_TEGGR|nr:hypothetical protein KUTeg_004059 [Tegillarca granosa]
MTIDRNGYETKRFYKRNQYERDSSSGDGDDNSPRDGEHFRRKHFICPIFRQQLGNQMFQYASSYGVAMLNNMSVIVGADDELTMIFKLQADIRKDKTIYSEKDGLVLLTTNCLHLNKTENYTLGRWLQSWKYFINVEDKLREQFVFKDHIQDQSTKIIQTI